MEKNNKSICVFFFSRSALIGIYNNLYKLNEDLISTHTIRQQNFVQMQKNLDAVNNVLKSAIRLRGIFALKIKLKTPIHH